MNRTLTSPVLDDQRRADLALAQRPLEDARGLPPWAYNDPAFYAAEEKYVLRREWLSVGRIDDVPESGDFFTVSLLGEPLIIARGDDGEIRALSAVCRHRAMVVASGRGRTERFVCPYHAWTYDTTGRLTAAPMMNGSSAFDKKRCALPQLRTEIWQGFIFVNFDPEAEPLAPRLKELDEILAPYRLAELESGAPPLDYEQHFNWKLLAPDNWENYHVLGVHAKSLLATGMFTPNTEYLAKPNGAFTAWMNPFKEGNPPPVTLKEFPGLPPELKRGWVGVHVYPCHLFLASPEDSTYYRVLPQSVDNFQLEVRFSVLPELVDDPAFKDTLANRRAMLDFVHVQEDAPALEATARGLRSSLFEQGCLSPEERPLWEFYNYLVPKVLEGLDNER